MNLIEQYIVALANLYGHVTKEQIVEVYNQQNAEKISVAEVEGYIKQPPQLLEANNIYIKQGEFLEEGVYLFEDAYDLLIEKQKNKPYYIPEKEKLLKYVKLNYSEEPKEYEELKAFIKEKIIVDNEVKAENLVFHIFLAIKYGDYDIAMQEFDHAGVVFKNKKDILAVTDIIKRLNNNTRMQENNGFTPNELSKIEQEKRDEIKKSPGRNDPCHCGSGKKYKKCCLKKDRLKELNIN